jgi:Flp pilus assembly protein TadD
MQDTTHPSSSLKTRWFAAILALLSLFVAGYAISLVRDTMEQQAKLIQENESISQQLKSLSEKLDQASSAKTNQTSSTDQASQKTQLQASAKVILPERSSEGNEAMLETELELLADKLTGQFSRNAEAIHVAAMIKAQTRQYASAQSLWEKCIELSPDKEMYFVNLATVAIEQGDNSGALDVLQNAKAKGLSFFGLLYHQGIALTKLGRLEEAVAVLQEAQQLRPDAADAWLIMGQAKLELGQAEQAESAFRKAQELGANSPSLLVGLGNASARQGKREEAKAYLDQFKQLSESSNLTGSQRFQALNGREVRNTALTAFHEAAIFYSKQKNFFETERLLLLCISISANNRDLLLTLADLYFKNQMIVEERTVRQRIVQLTGASFDDYVNLAKTHAVMGDRNSAQAVLKSAATAFPTSVQPFAALSQFHLEAQELAAARWYAEQSLDRRPSVEGFRFLASICDKMNDATGANQARNAAAQFAKEAP